VTPLREIAYALISVALITAAILAAYGTDRRRGDR
jgi:hypothetical protein